jgi:galacturonokinase
VHFLTEIHSSTGVYGGRFSGAGFRGCCIAFVEAEQADQVCEQIAQQYRVKRPELAKDAPVFVCSTDDGAEIMHMPWHAAWAKQ